MDRLTFSYKKQAAIVVVVSACLRLLLSLFLELGNDESYYWTYSLHLQWNYFDHPPMIALWERIFSGNLLLQGHVFFLRLGSFAGCALSSLFIYRTAAALAGGRAGFIAVFLYNISFYATITAGLMVTPDAPQMVFWTLSMFLVTIIVKQDQRAGPWICFGISAGLCIMSKVHGVFLWAGVGLYAILYCRRLFRNPYFYLALLLTAMVSAPIFIWNFQNDFVTWRFHSSRVIEGAASIIHPFRFLKEIIGELIINNPFNVFAVAVLFFSRRSITRHSPAFRIFFLTAIPLLLIIFLLALFRVALPHWSGPVYVTLIPFAAVALAGKTARTARIFLNSAACYTVLYFTALIFSVNFYPGTFSSATGKDLGRGDISLDSYGWEEAGKKFALFYRSEHYPDLLHKPPLVCNYWSGAHAEYYFARPLSIPMIGLGNTDSLHHYIWRNKLRPAAFMDTAYCIINSDEYYDPQVAYSQYYNRADSVSVIHILRGGKPAHDFYIFRLSGWRRREPAQ